MDIDQWVRNAVAEWKSTERQIKIETELYLMMNIHEFGKENKEIILLIHMVDWCVR